MKWYLADAIALALDEKREHPEIDFPRMVDEIWGWMQRDNEEQE